MDSVREQGDSQAEEITVAGSDQPVSHTRLLELARFILAAGHQDAVAWEEAGRVRRLMNLESQNR
ncbi:MAG: hypothetical protein U0401_25770 [Anaerolineae bacterium]